MSSLSEPAGARPTTAPDRDRSRRWLLLIVVVAVPFVVLAIVLATRTWYPTGDQAQAELRMRSLPGRPPLLGQAGRIADDAGRQGNHPGPLMYWVTWPVYALLGRSAWAYEAATLTVNLAWLAVAVWLVRRQAGLTVAAWFAGTALVLVGGFGLDALSQPWNPWVSLFPFGVLVLATWRALDGWRGAPALAVAAGSFALQGHVGYAPVTLPLVALAVVAPALVARRRRSAVGRVPDAGATASAATERDVEPVDAGSPREPGRGWRRSALAPVALAGLVGLLAWSGPFVDLLTNDPTNLSKLLDEFGSPGADPVGLGEGLRLTLRAAAPFGSWMVGTLDVQASILPGLALLVVWGAVAVEVARRRAEPSLTRLNVLLAVALAFGVYAVSRIFGSAYLYVFRWITVLVALVVFSLGWGIATLLPRPGRAVRRRAAHAGLAALVVLSASTAVRVGRQDIPYGFTNRLEAALAPTVVDTLDHDRRYLVAWDDDTYLGGLGFGLMLELERHGFDVGAEPRFEAAVEPHRVDCPGDYDAVVTVVTGPQAIDRWREDPTARLLAEVGSADPDLDYDATFEELRALLRSRGEDLTPDQLERTMALVVLKPGQDQDIVDLAVRLVDNGIPSAVFLQDPAPPAPPVDELPTTEPCWKD